MVALVRHLPQAVKRLIETLFGLHEILTQNLQGNPGLGCQLVAFADPGRQVRHGLLKCYLILGLP